MPARLERADIGCWVIKSRRSPPEIAPDWSCGTRLALTRCLRRSYRVELMAAGQPCLLWVSGASAGVQALGRLTSEAYVPEDADPSRPEVAVTVTLDRLETPVTRSVLLADHVLSGAEVIRMPAGSNPSYLSPERMSALTELFAPEELARSGWS